MASTSKLSSSSRRVKHPETHKQRRPELPRSNPVEKTSKILAPELPGQFMTKRSSVRSQLTAVTHDSHSTVASEQSHVGARILEEEDESLQQERRKSAFFIPGITGKARCLDVDSPVRRHASRLEEAAELSVSESRGSHNEVASKKSVTSRGSRGSQKSAGAGSSTSSSEPNLDQAHALYDAVIDSIHLRRDEGTNDLDEEDFQRMVQLLQSDVDRLDQQQEETRGLREQVTSIQNLLSDYEKKKRIKQTRKSRRVSA